MLALFFLLSSLFLFIYLFTNNKLRTVYCNIVTLPRDLYTAVCFIRFLILLKYWEYKNYTVAQIFQKCYTEKPYKTAFRCEDKVVTFKQVETISNQLSRYFKEECKLKRDDTVALYLPNSEFYPVYWLALSKIGVISALINTNQVGQVLQHSLKISEAKTILYDTMFTPVLSNLGDFVKQFQLINVGEGEVIAGSKSFTQHLHKFDINPLTEEIEKGGIHDKLLYIYTSGTTGLPKAAVITHIRVMMMAVGSKICSGITSDDVVYCSLPLYHTAGGVLGVGQTLLGGSTIIIRKKFSASNFWADCIKYDCTVAQYIGEMCRFLLSTPESPKDRAHNVRLVIGNGLRPQIWEKFIERFRIKHVAEFYGSTEGNANLINTWNKIGAVGYVPWFANSVYPLKLIVVDEKTCTPIRNPETGLCIESKPNEPGLLIGRIIKWQSTNSFNGYVDQKATEKKILQDVFSKGDIAVNSGDILVRDEYNYIYFKDRTGDTFRWKGENVSTCEVEAVISNIVNLKDATVYGVEIPDVEGRAGMVAIMDEEKQLDLKILEDGVMKELSSFARPVFVRVINQIPMTGTFKMQKNLLQSEGFDIHKISDPIYILRNGKYIKLDEITYSDIINNKIHL